MFTYRSHSKQKKAILALCSTIVAFLLLVSSMFSPAGSFFSPKKAEAADVWWNASWQKRTKITFSNASRGALANFPIAVYLNSSRVSYGDFSTNGNDIRFIDADGTTQLDYEIEQWNTSGTSTIWVKVPDIASSNADYVYMYYGNSGASAVASTTAVWDSNFILVDHMNSNTGGTAPQSKDSVTNFAIGTTTSVATTTGIAGVAYDMNGSSSFVGWATSTFPVLAAGTLEVWADPDSVTGDRYLFSNVKAGSTIQGEWRMFIDSANTSKIMFKIECGATANNVLSDSAMSSSTGWFNAAAVWNSSGGTGNQKLYVNSTLQASTGNAACGMEANDNYAAGKNNGLNNSFFDGQMDELRISNIARSADWISATYSTIKDTMNTFDAGDSLPGQPSALVAYPYENRAYLRWSPSSGVVTDYLIEYKLANASSWSLFADATSTGTSTMVTGLTNGQSYNFRVLGVNDNGLSASSTQATTTPAYLMSFVSPTIGNGISTTSASITGFASTTLSSSITPSYFTFRLETSGGSLVSQATTSTRYGDYNIANLATTTNKQNLSLTGDLSGVAYVPTTDTLFTIHNNQNVIHEVTRAGVSLRTITCSACNDAEDITLVSSVASTTAGGYDHTFMISTEDVDTTNHQIFRVVIHSTGAATVDRTKYYSTGISSGAVANSGLEGIAYNPNNGYFFAAAEGQESSAGVPGIPKLYEVVTGNIATHSATSRQICTNIDWAAQTLTNSSEFPASAGYSDISGLYFEPSNNHLYVLSHLADKMLEVDVTSTSSCTVLREKRVYTRADNGSNFLYEMPEGITWDATGDYLYVATEADYWSVWRTTSYGVRNAFSGLADGSYNMYVSVTDAFGNTSTSTARSFTVSQDQTSPSITIGSHSISTSTATLNWTTDENASSSVAYGLTASYGTVSTSSGHSSHTVALSGLSPSTTYHYSVHAVDAWGNTRDTSDATFTTSADSSGSGNNGNQSNAAESTVVPGSMTGVSGPSMSFADLQAIFGNRAVQPPVNPLANGQANSASNAAPNTVIGSGVIIANIYAQGRTSSEIRTIQRLLNAFTDTRVAAVGAGSPGKETDFFGPATKRAVEKFQLKFGIVKNQNEQGYGVVGPKTRAKINELLKKP